MMGSPASDAVRCDNETQHQVTISKPFWMGMTQVTQAQWQALMGNNPSNFKGNDLPVEQVSWDDVVSFCKKLTDWALAAGTLPAGYECRLPTEAEWEYACRAGTTGAYAGDLDRMGWYDKNSDFTSHAVAGKDPNAWGLYDMHGNVGEWCQGWYGDYPAGAVIDPIGPVAGDWRVSRGGGWLYPSILCRSANRGRCRPDGRDMNLGFRVALVAVRP